MGAEKITEKIIADANVKAEKIIAEAQAEAQSIADEAAKIKAEKVSEGAKVGENEANLVKTRIVASAHMEAKKLLLKTKQDLLGKAFDMAKKKIDTMEAEEFEKLMTKLMVSMIETGNESVIICENDKKRLSDSFIDNVNKAASSKITLSDEKRDIASGFILKRGDVEINATIEALFRQKKDELSAEVVKILF